MAVRRPQLAEVLRLDDVRRADRGGRGGARHREVPATTGSGSEGGRGVVPYDTSARRIEWGMRGRRQDYHGWLAVAAGDGARATRVEVTLGIHMQHDDGTTASAPRWSASGPSSTADGAGRRTVVTACVTGGSFKVERCRTGSRPSTARCTPLSASRSRRCCSTRLGMFTSAATAWPSGSAGAPRRCGRRSARPASSWASTRCGA